MKSVTVAADKGLYYKYDLQEPMNRILILQSSLREKREATKAMSTEELKKLCESYLKLAGLYKHIGNYKNAENCYLDAIAIKRKLTIKGNNRAEECLASIYENLGDIYIALGKEDKALIAYLSAVKVYEKLHKGNPEPYEKLLGDKYFLLGNLYKNRGLSKEAEKLLLKAENFFLKRDFKTSNKELICKLIELHDNLGDIYLASKDCKKAEKEYFYSFDLRQKLSTFNSKDYYSDKSISFVKLGDLYRLWGKAEESEEWYIKAIRMREEDYLNNCSNSIHKLSFIYSRLANLYNEQGRFNEANLYTKKVRYIESEII